jgi:hypothetical protein
MNSRTTLSCLTMLTLAGWIPTYGQEGFWTPQQTADVLQQTLPVSISADLSALGKGERLAIEKLLEVGELMHGLYLEQRHPEALVALQRIDALPEPRRGDMRRLYHLFKGPIATTLDNRREKFVPVVDETPSRNVYPIGVDKSQMDKACADDPALRSNLLGLRMRVRRVSQGNLRQDRETLEKYPALATVHSEFAARIAGAVDGEFYAVPYAIAYAPQIMRAYDLLCEASAAVTSDDPEFAGYLRHRALDLLCGNYEAGDASWVTGRFKNLNAQIGSYETYDDALYGVKAFYSLSLLVRDARRSEELAAAIGGIQRIEDGLPYDNHKRVRDDIPVGVYNVVADFGQARGTNTATILPNEALHARRYGRTILLRYNIMTHPELFKLAQQRFGAAVAREFREDLSLEGGFQRTLWHEVGHYLGVDRTSDGRELGAALQMHSDTFEEMKADLVSLFSARHLHENGFHSDEALKAIYAGGILRVLQTNQPRREQPYQTMQLMQWNYFLENKLLLFDEQRAELSIDYDRYHQVVSALLQRVLQIQAEGDLQKAEAFIQKYTTWDEAVHERIAEKLRAALSYRFRFVNYEALPELPQMH